MTTSDPCKQCHKPLPPGRAWTLGFCSEECQAVFEAPAVGKPCTYQVGTDLYPATIVAVSPSGSKLTLRDDRALGKGKFAPAAGKVEYAYRTKDGWYRVGGSGRLYIGERRVALDPNF